MKLSNPLSKKEMAALAAAREDLKAPLASLTAHSKKSHGLSEKMRKLESEFDKTETAAAGGNRKASMELTAIMDQKRRLQLTIDLDEANAYELKEPLRQAANNAQIALGPVVRDLQTQIEDEIEEKLAPYWTEKSRARAIARESDAIRSLGQVFNKTIGESAAESYADAERLFALMEATLAGAEIWSFRK